MEYVSDKKLMTIKEQTVYLPLSIECALMLSFGHDECIFWHLILAQHGKEKKRTSNNPKR